MVWSGKPTPNQTKLDSFLVGLARVGMYDGNIDKRASTVKLELKLGLSLAKMVDWGMAPKELSAWGCEECIDWCLPMLQTRSEEPRLRS